MVEIAEVLDTFEEFIRYLATPVALGVVSSVVLQVIKRMKPEVEEGKAFVASIVAAVLMSVAATLVLPALPTLPPEVEQYWPFVVWFFQQVWYWFMKDRTALYKSG